MDPATGKPTFRTVDYAPPAGICGSGLIDLLGELFVTGLLDKSGHFDLEAPTARVRVDHGVPEYVVCRTGENGADHDIVLTESDVTSLMRAKAAIYAGYMVMCRSVGVELGDVEQVLIGRGRRPAHRRRRRRSGSGCSATCPVDRFHFLGNTSLPRAPTRRPCCAGASAARRPRTIAGKMTYLELSADGGFMERVHVGAVPAAHRPRRVPERSRDAREARRRAGRQGTA